MRTLTYALLTATAGIGLLLATGAAQPPEPAQTSTVVSEKTRGELLAARDAAWRAFFTEDPGRLESMLGPELIAIQQSQEKWESKADLIKMAHAIRKQGIKITDIKFPRTEIQLFGDVAVLYYTYVFGTAGNGWAVTDEGRGTEVFVRRDGKWVDVGWHLDNGAFRRQGDTWNRVG